MIRALGKLMLIIGILLLLPVIGVVIGVIGLTTPIIAGLMVLCLPLIVIGMIIGRSTK